MGSGGNCKRKSWELLFESRVAQATSFVAWVRRTGGTAFPNQFPSCLWHGQQVARVTRVAVTATGQPMKKTTKTTSIVLLLLMVSTASRAHALELHKTYKIVFPKIALALSDGERIEEIHLSVACGHIESIARIPDDWNIEVVSAVSAVEEFHASAGHGASRLPGIQKFNGAIHVTVGEKACFDVSATILTSGPGHARQINLPKSKLKLAP